MGAVIISALSELQATRANLAALCQFIRAVDENWEIAVHTHIDDWVGLPTWLSLNPPAFFAEDVFDTPAWPTSMLPFGPPLS